MLYKGSLTELWRRRRAPSTIIVEDNTVFLCVGHNKAVFVWRPWGIGVNNVLLHLFNRLCLSVFCVHVTEYYDSFAHVTYVSGVHRSFNTLPATVIASCHLVCLMTSTVGTTDVAELILNDRDIPMLRFFCTCLQGGSSVFQAKMVDLSLKSVSETTFKAFWAFEKQRRTGHCMRL